jgi:ParB-like chromosome segregation protein Spo0J
MLELRPIVVDENNIVLGGNMRLKACKEAGLKEVFIVKAENLTEEQKDEFIVKDNVGFGEWDWDMLANEWDVEKIQDWGLDVPIFKDAMDDDLKDLSSTIDNLYRIEIICKDEEHQENSYNKLIEEGYECRLLTL